MSRKPSEGFLALFGAPIGWFLQLCAGFAMASQPCFSDGEKLSMPHRGDQWTHPAMIILMGAGILIALASFLISSRVYNSSETRIGDSGQSIGECTAAARFLALWGMLLSAGFALATILSAIAFMVVPRCAG